MRYINLMGGEKPYLLVRSRNNLGAETRVSYAPSTAFYLADRAAGTPWATRLPFPVQVVERIETYDWISRNRFVTRYAYHHGYFDGLEREFRGFGMVEKRDTGGARCPQPERCLPRCHEYQCRVVCAARPDQDMVSHRRLSDGPPRHAESSLGILARTRPDRRAGRGDAAAAIRCCPPV